MMGTPSVTRARQCLPVNYYYFIIRLPLTPRARPGRKVEIGREMSIREENRNASQHSQKERDVTRSDASAVIDLFSLLCH